MDASFQTVHNAVTMLCGTEQLIGSLPEVKWAQQVRSLATELQEESLHVIVQHLPTVIRTQAFLDLCRVRRPPSRRRARDVLAAGLHVSFFRHRCLPLQREESTREPASLKKLCSAVREGVTVDNCCDLFAAVHCLCGDDMGEEGGRKQEEVKMKHVLCTEPVVFSKSDIARADRVCSRLICYFWSHLILFTNIRDNKVNVT